MDTTQVRPLNRDQEFDIKKILNRYFCNKRNVEMRNKTQNNGDAEQRRMKSKMLAHTLGREIIRQ